MLKESECMKDYVSKYKNKIIFISIFNTCMNFIPNSLLLI